MMKKKILIGCLLGLSSIYALFFMGCSLPGFSNGASGVVGESLSCNVDAAANVMTVAVGDPTLCAGGYENEPCAAVTVCDYNNSSNCTTINNILIDTGSYGLRVFKASVTGLNLLQLNSGFNGNLAINTGSPMAECAQFGTGSDWGPVKLAYVKLAGEPAVQVPIQVIDSTFGTTSLPSGCSDADTSASAAGYNGILGVGLATQDCGSSCATLASNGMYYSCTAASGGTCTSSVYGLNGQVVNPVYKLPVDNNGVEMVMCAVDSNSSGAANVSGSLIFGIGTQTNNVPTGAAVYTANSSGDFTTIFNSRTYTSSFIDSGSNGLFFSNTGITGTLPVCSSNDGFFCPTSVQPYTAIMRGANGASASVNFSIAGADNFLFLTNNTAYSNLGGSNSSGFDWGLPFFFGRHVFVGINGQPATVNGASATGPFWAF